MKVLLYCIILCAVTACATMPTEAPFVPMIDPAQYPDGTQVFERDKTNCTVLAREEQSKRMNASTGAVGGAIVGSLIFLAVSGDTWGMGRGAAVGALGGAAQGATSQHNSFKSVLTNCLEGRGHKVINK